MKDEFNKGALYLLALTSVGSVFNYASQIAMGRIFSVEAFGRINVMFSFIYILIVLGNGLNQLASKMIAISSGYLKNVRIIAFTLTVVVSVTLVFLQRFIGGFLGIDSNLVLWSSFVIVALFYISLTLIGCLSGMKKFVAVGFLNLIMPALRFFGVGVVFLLSIPMRFQENFVLLFMIFGLLITILIAWIILRVSLKQPRVDSSESTLERSFVNSTIAILAISLLFAVYSNADLLLINLLFGETVAGEYSSAMLFGRMIFFLVTTLSMVMLPMVAAKSGDIQGSQSYLKKGLGFAVVISIVIVFPVVVLRDFLIVTLFGDGFVHASVYVVYACAIAISLSLISVTYNYLIGMGRYRVLIISFVFGIVGVIIAAVFAVEVTALLLSLILVFASVAVLNIFVCFWRIK